MNINDVIRWCDGQSQDNKQVAIIWDGGNDSGWVHLQVDGEETSSKEAEWLVEKMCSMLDYGSWAGEFNASGSAVYDPETKTFEGEDIYTEDETDTLLLIEHEVILIKIPKKYYFETLDIQFDNVLDGGGVEVTARIKNGVLNKELTALCTSLETEIEDEACKLLTANTKCEWSGYHTVEFGKSAIKEAGELDPEFYVFKITELDYISQSENISGVAIDLNEYAEQLNDEEL